ncbi:hypothetical protein GCM10010497_24040 [Streptomyces cinereoruber]|uniref:Uncharacterized protein n=1 Tax=Streptomyces cinereoruber TaxID=67260 RepID=A0AAV4KH76_9ACTN|nr:hypothetical protein GCM10010497_24040 [Streptomyces cinereoruber]
MRVPALGEELAELVLGDDRPGAQAEVAKASPHPPARRDTCLRLGFTEGRAGEAEMVTDDDLPQVVAVHLTASDQPDIHHDHHATPR